jgi:hypothetical protein
VKGYGFLLILVVGSNMDGTRRLPTHNDGQYQRCGGAIGDLTGKEKKGLRAVNFDRDGT